MVVKMYRKNPVVIEAIQWDGNNLDDVMTFCAGNATYELMARGNSEVVISTLEDGEGTAKHVASCGDFIIKGIAGEFYPCKPDIFEATYTPEDTPAENDRLIEALVRMENCCEQLAATRSMEIYTAMIDGGQAQALLDLDVARRNARAALEHKP